LTQGKVVKLAHKDFAIMTVGSGSG